MCSNRTEKLCQDSTTRKADFRAASRRIERMLWIFTRDTFCLA